MLLESADATERRCFQNKLYEACIEDGIDEYRKVLRLLWTTCRRNSSGHNKLGNADATAGMLLNEICKIARHANQILPIEKRAHARRGLFVQPEQKLPHLPEMSTSARCRAKAWRCYHVMRTLGRRIPYPPRSLVIWWHDHYSLIQFPC